MHNFVEYGKCMLISPSFGDSKPSSINNLQMLHNFVTPVPIFADSTCTASSSIFILKNNYPKQQRYIRRENVCLQMNFFSKILSKPLI